ncbi:MAG TPA: hypothetical protein VGE74_13030, partial [Gemmata sp.]
LAKVSGAVEAQKELTLALADRVRVQSDLLSRRAEVPPAAESQALGPQTYQPHCERCPAFLTEPESVRCGVCAGCRAAAPTQRIEGPTVTVLDDPEADLPAPYPSVPATAEAIAVSEADPPAGRGIHGGDAAGKEARAQGYREAVLRALAGGSQRSRDIITATGIPSGSMTETMGRGIRDGVWARVDAADPRSAYQLTDAGRQALVGLGYIVSEPPTARSPLPERGPILKAPEVTAPPAHEVGGPVSRPDVETGPLQTAQAAGETCSGGPVPDARPETSPAVERIDPTDAQARARAQAKLIAEAIAAAREPLLPAEIANKAGLPAESVLTRLRAASHPHQGRPEWCYFVRNPNGTWKLTNAGFDLAREGTES